MRRNVGRVSAEACAAEHAERDGLAVLAQRPGHHLAARERQVPRRAEEHADVIESRLVDPVHDDQLGAEIEVPHLGAAELEHLRRSGVLAVEHEAEADVIDAAPRGLDLVRRTVLDDGACERQVADPGDIGERFGART